MRRTAGGLVGVCAALWAVCATRAEAPSEPRTAPPASPPGPPPAAFVVGCDEVIPTPAIAFDWDWHLARESIPPLRAIGASLADAPALGSLVVEVDDAFHDPSRGASVGQSRGQAVRRLLLHAGADPARVTVQSFTDHRVDERSGVPRRVVLRWLTPPPGCVARPVPPDTDHDGLDDAVDACPSVAEDHDGRADRDGCPEPERGLATLGCEAIELERAIRFARDRRTPTPDSVAVLDDVAALLRDAPSVRVVYVFEAIHHDPRRANDPEPTRAHAAVEALVARGVERARLFPRLASRLRGPRGPYAIEFAVYERGMPCGAEPLQSTSPRPRRAPRR